MEYNQVKDLISTITNTDIKVFELKFENVDIKIDRNIRTEAMPQAQRVETVYTQGSDNVVQQQAQPVAMNNLDVAPVAQEVKGDKVVSPIVGTYYDKSSPDAEPFVKVGSKVKKGDVLFIIEAMKVINEITSEYDGEVLEILVRDGQMVEFEQPLMIIG